MENFKDRKYDEYNYCLLNEKDESSFYYCFTFNDADIGTKQYPRYPTFQKYPYYGTPSHTKDTAWVAGAVVDQIHFVRYDRNGRKIAENSLKPDGSADSKIIFVYDKDGNVVEEVIASIEKGGVSNVYQYHYDAQGRMDGKKKLNAQRTVVGIDTIIRNEAGLITQRIYAGVIYSLKEPKGRTYREAVNILYNDEGQVTEVIEESTLNSNGNPGNRKLQKRHNTVKALLGREICTI